MRQLKRASSSPALSLLLLDALVAAAEVFLFAATAAFLFQGQLLPAVVSAAGGGMIFAMARREWMGRGW